MKAGKFKLKTMLFISAAVAVVFAFYMNAVAQQQEVRLKAAVNSTKIGINENLVYQLSIEGAAGRIELPKPPDFKKFDVLNTQQSRSMYIVNGRMSSALNITYYLLPKSPGKVTLAPAVFKYQGKEYKSNSIDIEIVKGESKPNQAPPQKLAPTIDPEERDNGVTDNLFFKASVNKANVTVNEPILLTFGFYRRVNVSGANVEMPDFSGFHSETLKSSNETRETYVDGRRYLIDEWSIMLFPASPGDYTIKPAKLKVATSPFEPPYQLKTNPIKIHVTDFPAAGKPDDFNGAVGVYKLKAELKKNRSRVNDPVTLKVVVSGNGNAYSIGDLNVKLPPDMEMYESKDSANVVPGETNVSGQKVFEYALLPRSPGKFELGPVRFSYYDYSAKKYKTLESQVLTLKVEGTAAGAEIAQVKRAPVKVLKRDVNYIKTADDVELKRGEPLCRRRGFWMMHLLLPAAVGLTALAKRRRSRMRDDVALARSTRAKGFAAGKLRKAGKLLKEGGQKEFFATVHTTLCNYLADKMNVSPGANTAEELVAMVVEKLGEAAPEAELRECFTTCDAGRFSTFGLTVEDMRKTYETAAGIIDGLERKIRRAG